MYDYFTEVVKDKIREFNETRGRRKVLDPTFVDDLPLPNRKYGRVFCTEDGELPDSGVIDKMAGATVRTMLRLKPRPFTVMVGMFRHKEFGEYLFRFKVPRN